MWERIADRHGLSGVERVHLGEVDEHLGHLPRRMRRDLLGEVAGHLAEREPANRRSSLREAVGAPEVHARQVMEAVGRPTRFSLDAWLLNDRRRGRAIAGGLWLVILAGLPAWWWFERDVTWWHDAAECGRGVIFSADESVERWASRDRNVARFRASGGGRIGPRICPVASDEVEVLAVVDPRRSDELGSTSEGLMLAGVEAHPFEWDVHDFGEFGTMLRSVGPSGAVGGLPVRLDPDVDTSGDPAEGRQAKHNLVLWFEREPCRYPDSGDEEGGFTSVDVVDEVEIIYRYRSRTRRTTFELDTQVQLALDGDTHRYSDECRGAERDFRSAVSGPISGDDRFGAGEWTALEVGQDLCRWLSRSDTADTQSVDVRSGESESWSRVGEELGERLVGRVATSDPPAASVLAAAAVTGYCPAHADQAEAIVAAIGEG